MSLLSLHPKAAKEFFERIGMPNKPVHNTMIIGGGKAAYYLGKMLLDMGIEVKIIEMDRKALQGVECFAASGNDHQWRWYR